MINSDIPTLRDRLCEIADVAGIRHPTEHALRVWFHTLAEFAIGDVAGFLIEWPKHSGKMPSPSDCWKRLNERRTEAIERQAAAEKAQEKRDIDRLTATAYGRRMLGLLRGILNKPKPTEQIYRQCVRRMWAQEDAGKTLLPIQLDYIRRNGMTRENDADEEQDALARENVRMDRMNSHEYEAHVQRMATPMREPGEDREEEEAHAI